MRYFLLAAFLTIAGCADYDLRALSTLEPTGEPGQFRWKTIADAVYPENSPKAEQLRLAQLGKVMGLNADCMRSYIVENRTATRKVDGLAGDIYDVFYTVRCN
jgi:hypothetical protein